MPQFLLGILVVPGEIEDCLYKILGRGQTRCITGEVQMANTLKTAEKEISSFYEGENFKPCLTKQLSNMFNFGVHGAVVHSLPLGLPESLLVPKGTTFHLNPTSKNRHLRGLGIKSILNTPCHCWGLSNR